MDTRLQGYRVYMDTWIQGKHGYSDKGYKWIHGYRVNMDTAIKGISGYMDTGYT